MEGRALNREPRAGWAWVVVWTSASAVNIATAAHERRAFCFAIGLAAGAAWQLLYRRDLTSRLTFAAAVVTVAVISALVTRTPFIWEDMDSIGLWAIGILAGLIFWEQAWRWRDRRRQPVAPIRQTTKAG